MDDIFKKLNKASKNIRLTEAEKDRVRAELVRRMGRAIRPLRSPYVFMSIFQGRTLMRVMPVVLILLLAGGGVSYAAEGALPGDSLYRIKTNVNEAVRVAVTTDAAARAALETELASRRLDEAAELASQGSLSDTARAEIEANFKQHAAGVNATIAMLAHDNDENAAAEASSNFESSLLTHGAILASLAAENTQDAQDQNNTQNPAPKAAMMMATSASTTSEAASSAAATAATSVTASSLSSIVQSIKIEARKTIASRASIEAKIKQSGDTRSQVLAEARQASAEKIGRASCRERV